MNLESRCSHSKQAFCPNTLPRTGGSTRDCEGHTTSEHVIPTPRSMPRTVSRTRARSAIAHVPRPPPCQQSAFPTDLHSYFKRRTSVSRPAGSVATYAHQDHVNCQAHKLKKNNLDAIRPSSCSARVSCRNK